MESVVAYLAANKHLQLPGELCSVDILFHGLAPPPCRN